MQLIRPTLFIIHDVVAREVTSHEAFVFAVIYWFEKMKDGVCYASNERIMEALPYESSEQSISNALSTLESHHFIKRIYTDASKRNRTKIVCLIGEDKITKSVEKRHSQSKKEGGIKAIKKVSDTPTGVSRYTHRCISDTPTGVQKKNIELDNLPSEVKTSRVEKFQKDQNQEPDQINDEVLVSCSEEGEFVNTSSKKKPERLPEAEIRAVFDLFGKDEYSLMRRNKTQREAIKTLLKEKGIVKIKNALRFYLDNREKDMCPQIFHPYDLICKWKSLLAFKKRNEL